MNRTSFFVFATLLLATGVQAQFSRPGASGPGLSPSTAKLFGDNTTFSAIMEMQTGDAPASGDSMVVPGKLFFDEGKSRFEMDLSQLKGASMPPEVVAQMKGLGMDKTVMISRPDKGIGYQVYPGLHAFVENPLPKKETTGSPEDFKMELSDLGKETVEGHLCIKSKAMVTGPDGERHESVVWKATDLKKFPIKIEHMEDGTKVTMLFRDVKLSRPAANLFEPPADCTKYDSTQALAQKVMMDKLKEDAVKPGQ